MKNLITYDQTKKVFHLQNNQVSYVFSIEEYDQINQLYFGKAVKSYHGQRQYPRIDRGFSGNLAEANQTDRTFSLDTLLREFSCVGEGDFRISAAKISQSDGSYAFNFKYTGFKIEQGKPKLSGLPAAYVEQDSEAETLFITMIDAVSQLEMVLLYTIYRDLPIITRSVQLNNLSSTHVEIQKLASFQLDLAPDDFTVISFPGAHNRERQIQEEIVKKGIRTFSSRRGTTSHHMNNSIILKKNNADEFQGEVYGFNLVYSGNHAFELEQDQLNQLRIIGGINEDGFSWDLAPNEIFQTPEVLMAYSDRGVNKMSQAFHHLMTTRIARGKFKTKDRAILINNWEATYFDFDEERLKPLVDKAAEVGIEMFVLDDGWFGQRNDDTSSLGDWFVDEKKFPNGLNHFADYVHSKDLWFGLWMEPEMISINSDLYRQHPNYVLTYPNRNPAPSRSQHVLDLGRNEVRENIFQQLSKLFEQGTIDYVKWDMNRSISELYSLALNPKNQGEVMHRYVLGLYELLDNLTEKYPDILWEGCSGGGGRFDSGMLYYMPQSWTSDNTDAIERLKIQYGTSMIYPPSSFTSHVSAIPNHQTGRSVSLNTRGNVAMSSVFGYELDLTKATVQEQNDIVNQISFYKEIRRLVQFGIFTRLKSPFDTNQCAWQFHSEHQKEILVFAFKILNEGQEPSSLLRLENLDEHRLYQASTGEIYGGDELMNIGFYLPQQSTDFSSWEFRFTLVEE